MSRAAADPLDEAARLALDLGDEAARVPGELLERLVDGGAMARLEIGGELVLVEHRRTAARIDDDVDDEVEVLDAVSRDGELVDDAAVVSEDRAVAREGVHGVRAVRPEMT